MGEGKIHFWNDAWIPGEPKLVNLCNTQIPERLINKLQWDGTKSSEFSIAATYEFITEW